MTRLQKAKNQLIEALEELESASFQIIVGANEADVVASPSQMGNQKVAYTDLSALVDEVSIIEVKLDQAMTMIAAVESGEARTQTINDGEVQ